MSKPKVAGVVAFILLLSCTLAYLNRGPVIRWVFQQPWAFDLEIQSFLDADEANPPKPGAIVFTGSSSIRYWDSLTSDFPERYVLNRGFGGSQTVHVLRHLDAIVLAYEPSAVVVYVGENDIAAGKTVAEIISLFEELIERIHVADADTDIVLIGAKPSPKRWHLWDSMQNLNQQLADFSKADNRIVYVDVAGVMLSTEGTPDPNIFVADALHMNAKGYALWKPKVEAALLSLAP